MLREKVCYSVLVFLLTSCGVMSSRDSSVKAQDAWRDEPSRARLLHAKKATWVYSDDLSVRCHLNAGRYINIILADDQQSEPFKDLDGVWIAGNHSALLPSPMGYIVTKFAQLFPDHSDQIDPAVAREALKSANVKDLSQPLPMNQIVGPAAFVKRKMRRVMSAAKLNVDSIQFKQPDLQVAQTGWVFHPKGMVSPTRPECPIESYSWMWVNAEEGIVKYTNHMANYQSKD